MAKQYKFEGSKDDPVLTVSNLERIKADLDSEFGLTSGRAGGKYYILVTCDADYNTHTFTATNTKLGNTYEVVAQDGRALFIVDTPGTFQVTNDLDDNSGSVTVGEGNLGEVDIHKFTATINVDIPQELVGSTIECKCDEQPTLEQKAEVTALSFTVRKEGSYTVGVKGNQYITTTVEISSDGQVAQGTLSLEEGVPIIDVTLGKELIGQTLICSKDGARQVRNVTTTSERFILSDTGTYLVGIQNFESISESVQMDSPEIKSVSLNADGTVPILTVKVKDELEGEPIKVEKDLKSYTKIATNKECIFLLPETGTWEVSSTSIPDKTRKLEITENKTYNVIFPASIWGVRIKKAEKDPKKRVEPTDDLVGLRPMSIDQSTCEVDYGDMEDTWLFDYFNHVVAVDMTTAEEIELDPYDYSKKLDGSEGPDITINGNYNVFARVPKLYTYQHEDSTYEYLQISDTKIDDNYVPNGFYNANGEENDYMYTGVFLGAKLPENVTKLRSVTDEYIICNHHPSEYVNRAGATGKDYYIDTYACVNVYEIAYLCLVQNEDSRNAIGLGRTRKNWGSMNYPYMQMKTGIANDKGPMYLDQSSRAVKFMHIEDFWGRDMEYYMEGLLLLNGVVYAKMKPPYSHWNDSSGYTKVSKALSKSGYVRDSTVSNDYGRIPCHTDGDSSSYECDQWGYSTGSSTPYIYSRGWEGVRGYMQKSTELGYPYDTGRLNYIPTPSEAV